MILTRVSLNIIVLSMSQIFVTPCLAQNSEHPGSVLIAYCQACHGIGKLRFIYSKNPAEVWTYIQTKSPQGSTRLWSEEIRDALSWPDDKPPPAGSLREPGKEWMPKGSRRQDIHADRLGDVSAREFLLERL